jgi:hypothetical protein
MIDRTGPNADIEREDVQPLHDAVRAVVERDAATQLCGRQPQFAGGVDPHGVDPELVWTPHLIRAALPSLLSVSPIRPANSGTQVLFPLQSLPHLFTPPSL